MAYRSDYNRQHRKNSPHGTAGRRIKVKKTAEIKNIFKKKKYLSCTDWKFRVNFLKCLQKHLLDSAKNAIEHNLKSRRIDSSGADQIIHVVWFAVDETLVYYYIYIYYSWSKGTMKVVDGKGKSAPNKARLVSSAGVIMAMVFRNSHGIAFIDYLEKCK